jgi:hypothetical protein
MLCRNTVRYWNAQVGRYPVDIGMECELVPGRRDQLTHGELLGARSDLDYDPAQRVAQRRVTVQPVHRLLVRRQSAILGSRIQELAQLIRPCSRFAHQ